MLLWKLHQFQCYFNAIGKQSIIQMNKYVSKNSQIINPWILLLENEDEDKRKRRKCVFNQLKADSLKLK